jgi:hypothetical protein
MSKHPGSPFYPDRVSDPARVKVAEKKLRISSVLREV